MSPTESVYVKIGQDHQIFWEQAQIKLRQLPKNKRGHSLQTDLSYGRANKRSQTERPSELDVNSLEGDTRDINSDPGAGVRQEDEVLVTEYFFSELRTSEQVILSKKSG